MVPTWVGTLLVLLAGCFLAYFIGATLPDYDVEIHGVNMQIYIVIVALVCVIAAVTNNFPVLLAIGLWMPFVLPLGMFSAFPTVVLVLIWMAVILFFRLCLTGTLRYVKSFNLYFLIVFAWVPIRFLMNPIHKLGASVQGGSGVSGATPYFMYIVAAAILVFLGAILNSREKLVQFMRWCFRLLFLIGVSFLICAFIPATGPFLYSWGVFAAGSLGDGIMRLVQLPAYGFFMIQAALCPHLFRLTKRQSFLLFFLGLAMMIVGGNRSTVAAAIFAIPVILILRRSTHILALTIGLAVLGIIMLRVTVAQMDQKQLSPLVRSLGIFDSSIDKASGGDESTEWRYEIWQSGIDKIMESPLTGKGFGNLPKNLDPSSAGVQNSGDFEVVLAGGEAHNGFVTAAYGFGIPFMFALTAGILVRMVAQMRFALMVDKHDLELRDLNAILASMYPAFLVNIYAAFDMSATLLWVYVAMGFILENLPKSSTASDPAPVTAQPAAPYMYPSRY